MHLRFPALVFVTLTIAATLRAADVDPNPPPPVLGRIVRRWTFEHDTGGWTAAHDCRLSTADGNLHVESTGVDPFLTFRFAQPPAGPLLVRMKARSTTSGTGQFYWVDDRSPHSGEDQSSHFDMEHDNRWHEYQAMLAVRGRLVQLRLDPGMGLGQADIAWIELRETTPYPLVIEHMETRPDAITLLLRNTSARPLEVAVAGRTLAIDAGKSAEAVQKLTGTAVIEAVPLAVEPKGFPPLGRTVVVYRPEAKMNGVGYNNGRLGIHVVADGSGAVIDYHGKPAAIIAPLALAGNKIARFSDVRQENNTVELAGDGIRATLTVTNNEIAVVIDSRVPVEGPVVRAIGGLEQGLFAGLEYLGKGEKSSSTLDIEGPEHLRFAPDVTNVTLPLMACVTDRASVAVHWTDMTLQPTFASPDFIDGTPGEHRMSLRGRKIAATIRIANGPVEEAIAWAVRKSGLPPPPAPPRDDAAQVAISLAAINGPIKGADGWGHCAEPNYHRQPFADIASTLFRLTGQPPQLERIVPGGGHIRNDSIYFVTGRARQWLDLRRGEVRGLLAAQKPDGSFRYQGRFQRGHYEDTASGLCALPAMRLLEFAWATGDKAALEGGLKTLDYMRRFRVPRGAQTWELSLHTPDILASAYLTWAYVRGYELTGRAEYLAEARRWALSGVPFVYLWGKYPTMLYATPPVYGASSYHSPVWIGLPVQWCGGVYAYALTLLAPHDETLDWRRLARGIFVAAQQIEYPDGLRAGCLPDVFKLPTQRRDGPSINPSALVSLQLALAGKPDNLAVAAEAKHRVAAPFAVKIVGNEAKISATAGLTYQILVDGKPVEVRSQGEDTVPLP